MGKGRGTRGCEKLAVLQESPVGARLASGVKQAGEVANPHTTVEATAAVFTRLFRTLLQCVTRTTVTALALFSPLIRARGEVKVGEGLGMAPDLFPLVIQVKGEVGMGEEYL
ncbi:hypothetical protein E2C01_100225 [Portunus trituberculatus]|uniref:Uncharacterized protein n=1 Tax=Portunus trituberculatus TaxID=210409 RepID=A0A5B7K2G6_PORTR|nr:hypothetical protein [Portunus trituberculatus]